MNQVKAAELVAAVINGIEDWRSTISQPDQGGVVHVCLSQNTGGKRGWIGAGEITVGQSIELSKEAVFSMRYCKSELAPIFEIEYQFDPTLAPPPKPKSLMLGSERQIEWAEQIKSGVLSSLEKSAAARREQIEYLRANGRNVPDKIFCFSWAEFEHGMELLRNQWSAKWWIDTRDERSQWVLAAALGLTVSALSQEDSMLLGDRWR